VARSPKYIRCNVVGSAGRRASWLGLGALSATLALACGGGTFPTVTELPKAPRRPDGVVLEPAPAMPDSVARSDAALPIAALHEPPDDRALGALVRRYFLAWEREDVEALTRLLSADATLLGHAGGRPIEAFRARLRRYEYQRIAGLEPARFDRLERHRYVDLDARQRPREMREGDLLLRVPVLVARIGGDPLFGDTLVLLVRREDEGLRVAAIGEESGGQ
jgi:hypothetical protein